MMMHHEYNTARRALFPVVVVACNHLLMRACVRGSILRAGRAKGI